MAVIKAKFKVYNGTSWDEYDFGSGSAPTNMVTTDTAQTISGVKRFASSPQIRETNNGDAYINFNTNTYAGLVFRYGDSGTSGQPMAEVTFNYDTDELKLYAEGGVVSYGIHEPDSYVPYKIGYKYCGYFTSSSSASNKFYISFQFFDDARFQGYISNRGMNITSMSNLIAALKRAGHTTSATACPASGKYGSNNVVGVYASGNNIYILYIGYSSNTNTVSSTYLASTSTAISLVNFTVINS